METLASYLGALVLEPTFVAFVLIATLSPSIAILLPNLIVVLEAVDV